MDILFGILDFLLGLIGLGRKSAQEKLGQEEVKNQDLQAALKEKTDEANLMERPDKPFPDVISVLRKHTGE